MSTATSILVNYFNCPPQFDCIRVPELQSDKSGFFRFGPELICYGRNAASQQARNPSGPLSDMRADVQITDGTVQMPFHPTEVVENLRNEAYASDQDWKYIKGVYYALRPLLSVGVRKHLQRFRLRDWKKLAFPHWPVDATVDDLHRELLGLCATALHAERIPFIWFWPEGASAAAMMTHDIETAVGLDRCYDLMDLDARYHISSSFQIIPEERYDVSEKCRQTLRTRGFEINIHDLNHDGKLFKDKNTFDSRAQKINYHARMYGAAGFRSGALYRNVHWLEKLAFSYDMSVPNVGHLDAQRGGCCTVMPYFIGHLLELPLTTTQDYTLFNVLGSSSVDLWKEQISTIRSRHGLISFNVHPDYLSDRHAWKCYSALLEYLTGLASAERIWIASPGEIDQWWRQRSEMTLVLEDGQWRIRGEGAERARLAWATTDKGKLACEPTIECSSIRGEHRVATTG